MRFTDRYNQGGAGPVISFEVFPPRNEAAEAAFEKALPELLQLGPDFMTVTYGAMGSTRDRTLDIAARIRREFEIPTASHLTCVGSTSEEIDEILRRLEESGVQNIVALRGDPPRGETEFRAVEGGYGHAIDLVRHIRSSHGDSFGIAVAGYPEKHLEAPDMTSDLAYLKAKVEAGADVVITQLFYDNASYWRFVEDAEKAGIACPIVPGLLPILSRKQILRITEMCGASIPRKLGQRLESAGDDAEAALEIGIEQAAEQARDLLENGAPGIHFYVLNRARHMRRIFELLPQKFRRHRG